MPFEKCIASGGDGGKLVAGDCDGADEYTMIEYHSSSKKEESNLFFWVVTPE